MRKLKIDRTVLTDASWWHWMLTVPLLAAHLMGTPLVLPVALALCAVMGMYFLWHIGEFRPYPVQVRMAYFGLLAMGALPGMRWIHWTQLAGTTAMVTVGYCPLIRLLSLLPANRSEPLSWRLIRRTFLEEPCAGGLLSGPRAALNSAGATCGLSRPAAVGTCSIRHHHNSQRTSPYAQVDERSSRGNGCGQQAQADRGVRRPGEHRPRQCQHRPHGLSGRLGGAGPAAGV